MTDEPMDPKTEQMSETDPQTSQKTRQAPTGAGTGPADLAELKATDALLDRLASRGLSASDRDDPLISAFAELRRSLDEPSDEVGHDVARLIEVLGDRPLYLVDAEEAGDGSLADTPINLGLPAPTSTRTVDVREVGREVGRDAAATGSADSPGTGRPVPPTPLRRPVLPQPAAQVAARVGDATTAAIGATVRTINSMTAGRRATHGRLDDADKPHWRQVAEQVAVPAASIVAVLTIGYGVSAAVTGDPMAPVAGVSRVVQQLPGVGPDTQAVSASIVRAGVLADQGQKKQAQDLIKQATDNVGDLPEAAQPSIKSQIDEVKVKLGNPASPAASPVATAPASSPSAVPSVAPSPSATAPTTTAPTTSSTVEPSASATAPTSSAATDPAP